MIAHNTIANNDSTATSSLLHGPGQAFNCRKARASSCTTCPRHWRPRWAVNFVSPTIVNDIVWHNRSYYFDPALNGNAGGLAPNPAGLYQDLTVFGTAGALNVTLLSADLYGGLSRQRQHSSGNPQFVQPYANTLETATVIDEGGNNVNIRYSPISATGDYHVASSSPAVNAATANPVNGFAQPQSDYDGQFRPEGVASDIGADESYVTMVIARGDFYAVNEDTTLSAEWRRAMCWPTIPDRASCRPS